MRVRGLPVAFLPRDAHRELGAWVVLWGNGEEVEGSMSTWPSMTVGTAEGDLPKLFSLNKGDLSLIFIQRHRLNYFNHTHAHASKRARARKVANTCTRARKHAHMQAHTRVRVHDNRRILKFELN